MHTRKAPHINRQSKWLQTNWRLCVTIVVVATIGVTATWQLLAAAATASIEAESGPRVGNVIEQQDGNASAGKAIEFRAPSSLPSPTWSDEFNGTALSYATDSGGGTWRTKGYESGSVNNGYPDYVGLSTWNATRAQIEQYGLISVQDGNLIMRTMRNPGNNGINQTWLGTYLVSNHLNNLTWRYGYFEWRASLPNPSLGMFPALWTFNNVPNRNDGRQSAEIDVLEIFGWKTGSPWDATLHMKPSGSNGTLQSNILTKGGTDVKQWHRYALNWTPNAITIYQDGQVMVTVNDNRATWFQNANLGIRMDYVMDPNFHWTDGQLSNPGDPAPGTKPRMEIDYVRYYSQMPANLPGGSGDPYK